MLLLWQDIVHLLHHLRDVALPGLSSCSRGRCLLQLRVTVAAESELAESDLNLRSADHEGQSPISQPRRVAVANQSSGDDQSKDDVSPWEVRSDLVVDGPSSRHSVSGHSVSGGIRSQHSAHRL